MAASIYQFDVDNDSPEIAYFPFVNLEPSSNVTAGWQLLYSVSGAATSPGEVGVGTSYHYTSLDGASLLINWNGTGIGLIGSVKNALYNISLDGVPSAYFADPTNSVLASFNDLENTNHELLLTTIITNSTSPDTFLVFDKATITYAPPAGVLNTSATSQVIANSDIAFMGFWSYVADSTGNSMHLSNNAGDTAEATFLGSAITIYGLTSSYSGNFTVILDNITTNLSALSSYNASDSLLFYATGLPQNILHHIAVVNQDNSTLALRAGGMNTTRFGDGTVLTASSSSGNSMPAGTIAAIVLAVVLFLLFVGIFYYACCIRRKPHTINQYNAFLRGVRKVSDKDDVDIERVSINPPSGEEMESTSLSTSKGYGFGLGLRRGFPLFAFRKNKMGSTCSGMSRSRNGTASRAESHLMTPQRDHDEKRLSIYTLTEDPPVGAPESEKLAPGWSNPVVCAPPSFKDTRHWEETRGILLPGLCLEPMGPVDDDYGDDADADVKTPTSRDDEAITATRSLSPRTAGAAIEGAEVLKLAIDPHGSFKPTNENRQPELLQVREISPFTVDMTTILGTRKSKCDSRISGSSTWSKVRAKIYRRTHQGDSRQNYTDRQDTSSSSGPESVPVVMHESGGANPSSEVAPGSGTYSFLDFTSSHISLGQRSKTTTLSSTAAKFDHSTREATVWSENTSIKMGRIEHMRDDILAPKPDAPSTASGGSNPSDNSANGAHAAPFAPATDTQTSPSFPFHITIPPSPHIALPLESVPEPHITPPSRTQSQSDQYLQIPQVAREHPLTPANSPTESVPFTVSEIHFRHSFSDQTGFDSQRASVASVLPPHPPLPHHGSSQASRPTYPPPPPYIVQRVLGLPTSPLGPLSPLSLPSFPRSPTDTLASARQPGAALMQPVSPFRVGSLLGPRPRPVMAGSVRGSAAPQLPMQGGRGILRGGRDG